jgi:hypothetical protein
MLDDTTFDGKHWKLEYKRVLSKARCAIYRCTDETHPHYRHYGGRGIRVHPEWVDDPNKFARYLLTLDGATDHDLVMDRIDNDGHYEPSNLRFVDRSESLCNRRPRPKKLKRKKLYVHYRPYKPYTWPDEAESTHNNYGPPRQVQFEFEEQHKSPQWWRSVPARGEPPDVSGMLNRLDERRRLAVQLRIMEGKTLEETGRALGVTKERARQIVENTLRRLRCLTSLEL